MHIGAPIVPTGPVDQPGKLQEHLIGLHEVIPRKELSFRGQFPLICVGAPA